MKRILTATAAVALMAASPLAFAADTTGAATANPSAPATAAPPDAGTSNPAMAPNGPTSEPSHVSGDTSQQNVTPPSHTSTSGEQDQEPAKVGGANAGEDQSGGASQDQSSSGGSTAPKHHHARHVGAKKRGGSASQERDITAALNVLSSNGYTNPQNLQATGGHKVSATATKEGQSVNVIVDPAAGTVSQQNS